MTNNDIIFTESQKLAEQGIIDYTGRTFIFEDADGNKTEVKETEPIHTFAAWKSLGYKVKKGEKAVAQFTIWKHSKPKMESLPDESGEYVDKGRMFMKKASFFRACQVEKMEVKANG